MHVSPTPWTPRRLAAFPLALLAACQGAPSREPTAVLAERPASAAFVPDQAARYAVESEASEIRLLVGRDGPLAKAGHAHVVVGRVRGELRAGKTSALSGFRLEMPVEALRVDPSEARAEEGAEFASQVSDQSKALTRDNMLGAQILDAARHPSIFAESVALAGPPWNPTVTARVTLRGATRELRFPAAVFRQGAVITVIANFRILQSEFGIEPFAALGGGLRVADAIDVRIRVVARAAGG